MANDKKYPSKRKNKEIQSKKTEIDVKNLNEVLKSLPEDKKKIITNAFFAMERSTFSGPIPPPELFKEYEEVLPGATERILKMAEKQQDHRTKIEEKIAENNFSLSIRGQIFGCFLAFVCLLVSAFLGYNGHDWLGGIIGGGSIISILIVFVLNKEPSSPKNEKNQDKEIE